MRQLAIGSVVLAAWACVAATGLAQPVGPVAAIEFQRGYTPGVNRITGLATRADQEYMVLDSDGLSFRRAALFNFLSSGRPQTWQAPVGRRLTINAITSYSQVSIGQCSGRAQFTPLEGHSYRVVQVEVRPAECAFEVTDTTTGEAPPDLEVVDDISGRAG